MKKKTTLLILLFCALFSIQINASNNTFAPPVNDDCANATTLTMNPDYLCSATSSGTVFEATPSITPNACPGSTTNATDDVWFKFVATGTSHKIELLNISGSQTNLYHSVFDAGATGDCSTLVIGDAIFCSDPNTSTLTGLTPLNTYFIRVYTNDAGTHDTTFDICVGTEPLPPANDDCANAETVASFPFNTVVDATSATNNAGFINVTGCGGGMNDGVWYTLVGDGSDISITVAPSGWDAKIAVYSGTCGTFTCIAEANNGLVGNTEAETFTSTSGTTYFINIGHPSGTSDFPEGAFNLEITASGLSIDDLVAKGFAYFPNPVKDELRMSAKEDIKSIYVYNMIGQEVKKVALSNMSSYKLDMSDLSKGIYFITAEIGGSTGTFKVIKK
jgi:hypothetical protein